jgi:DNA-binding PadR family transcriptional regulator
MDHESDEAIEDSWSRWEFPVLSALARWEQNNQDSSMISTPEIVDLVHAAPDDAWKVGRALSRLESEGLIVTTGATFGSPWPRHVMHLTTSGLRRAGAWPSAAAFQADLVERLSEAADRISANEPVKAGRLRQAAEILADKGTDVLAKVIAELAAKASGLRP